MDRSKEHFQDASDVICRNILSLSEIQKASHVAAFWPIQGEADIRPSLSHLMKSGTRIYLPQIEGSELNFISIDSLNPETLEIGAYGIPAPTGASVPLSAIDCVLVPGLGFDKDGNRLGKGKGFYDRALSLEDSGPFRIGVGFSDQIVEEGIETLAHDVPMHLVVTEEHIYRL